MYFKKIVFGQLYNNIYLISGDDKSAVIIDPSGGYGQISAELKKAGLTPAAVLLTHAHPDHIGGTERLRKDGVKVYQIPDRDYPAPYDAVLTDGETLNLCALKIKVIATPGHTRGGACFYLEKEKIIFTGDTLFHGDYGRTDFPGGDIQTLKKSIKDKLFTLPPDTVVYPGHEEETTVGEEAAHNAICFI